MKQERLKELFNYCDGNLLWKVQKSRATKIGQIAGVKDFRGYVRISIDRKSYYAHRLIWIWHYGELFNNKLDHINTNTSDNRIENLRLATQSQNNGNRNIPANNTSGHKGVSWSNQLQKWKAYIAIDGVRIHLGYFEELVEASAAYNLAAERHFGEFARLNYKEIL